ncbi:hypothetical protein CKO43_24940, partial [Rubrivivax gelatinosus]|nr:hypothetical protein [Rubrivivax gelatinosus]
MSPSNLFKTLLAAGSTTLLLGCGPTPWPEASAAEPADPLPPPRLEAEAGPLAPPVPAPRLQTPELIVDKVTDAGIGAA